MPANQITLWIYLVCKSNHTLNTSSIFLIKRIIFWPWLVWPGWASSCKLKVCQVDSASGHMPALWVRSPVGAPVRGNWLMFLSHIDVSPPLFIPPFPSQKIKIKKKFWKLYFEYLWKITKFWFFPRKFGWSHFHIWARLRYSQSWWALLALSRAINTLANARK